MSDLWIVIPRWEEFQHRDMARSKVPPWAKNFTRLLSDDAYLGLTGHQRGVLHGIWLEYARSLRVLPGTTLSLSRRLSLKVTEKDLRALNHAGFIQLSASKPASKPASEVAGVDGDGEKNLTRAVTAPSYADEPDVGAGSAGEQPSDFTHVRSLIDESLQEAR